MYTIFSIHDGQSRLTFCKSSREIFKNSIETIVNPAVVYHPLKKKYYLYFKGNVYDPTWRGVHGVAIADAPEGPFIVQDDYVFEYRFLFLSKYRIISGIYESKYHFFISK